MYKKLLVDVINKEISGLELLKDSINNDIEEICNLISSCKGKIIFTGIGKSGHIASKLAATYSSLGISSIFVHSTEGLHGDLGTITNQDIVICLSNSGETIEVVNMAKFLKDRNCVTIAFTSKSNSSLSRICDYKLVYPFKKEADYFNLAPTTSAITMLSLGDAIGISISKTRGFTKQEFLTFHPGGEIGKTKMS
ncbi:KpsF/GutQ family sugar-phosphate isomerase [Ignavigranum ruoffiae]|uniref:KpsF/GutQ family sugar-phosphate isomerase n=1 Tax=Ignavigranum ruoffiae TaxID=89093 RepID=UPI0024ACD807|nr:SIS domain-containing protein [Ignavigranum ruoffiae]